jgi:hypothetical protein
VLAAAIVVRRPDGPDAAAAHRDRIAERAGGDLSRAVREDGDSIWVLVGDHERKTWWRNLRSEQPVDLWLHGRNRTGRARAIIGREEPDRAAEGLAAIRELRAASCRRRSSPSRHCGLRRNGSCWSGSGRVAGAIRRAPGRVRAGRRPPAADRAGRAVPRLRQRLVPVPPACGRPIWVDDPAFDPARHLHVVSCPEPGNDHALLEPTADLALEPLPRTRRHGRRCSSPD